MKSCIILFCLLAVVYSEGVGDDKSLQEHKDLLEAKADAGKDFISKVYTNVLEPIGRKVLDLVDAKVDVNKNIISSFFGNILEPISLKFLVAQVIEWFAWLLVTAIFGQSFTDIPSIF